MSERRTLRNCAVLAIVAILTTSVLQTSHAVVQTWRKPTRTTASRCAPAPASFGTRHSARLSSTLCPSLALSLALSHARTHACIHTQDSRGKPPVSGSRGMLLCWLLLCWQHPAALCPSAARSKSCHGGRVRREGSSRATTICTRARIHTDAQRQGPRASR